MGTVCCIELSNGRLLFLNKNNKPSCCYLRTVVNLFFAHQRFSSHTLGASVNRVVVGRCSHNLHMHTTTRILRITYGVCALFIPDGPISKRGRRVFESRLNGSARPLSNVFSGADDFRGSADLPCIDTIDENWRITVNITEKDGRRLICRYYADEHGLGNAPNNERVRKSKTTSFPQVLFVFRAWTR